MTRRTLPLVLLLLISCAAPSAPSPSLSGRPQVVAPSPSPSAPAPTPFAPEGRPQVVAPPAPLAAGWWDDAVCYEVFVRSFADSNGDGIGDLNGLIQKLDYLNDGDAKTNTDLGVSCLWLMPIQQATSYHGYDVTDYYTVNKDYGTNDDFKRLVAEANQRGIKVIIDLVLNHTSVEHPWFKQALADKNSPYRNWYIWADKDPGYKSPWGDVAWHKTAAGDYYYGIFWSGMPDLNYTNPAVTAEAQKISQFWVKDMSAAGFRLDAIKHLFADGQRQENVPETFAWLRGYRAFLQTTLPGTFTIGEIFDGNPVTLKDYYPDQLDSYFEFAISSGIIQSANTGRAGPFRVAAENASGQLPFGRFAPFLANHDQSRAMTQLGEDLGKAKVAAAALLLSRGLPFMYYGEEIGITGARPPDEDVRTPMQWSADANAGFTTGTPWRAPQANFSSVNVAAQAGDPASLLSEYRRLIFTRRVSPALSHGDMLALTSSAREVAAFLRRSKEQTALVLINFGTKPASGVTLAAPAGTFAGPLFAQPLSAQRPGANLTPAADGSLSDYAPLAEIPPQSYVVYELLK